jgi:hypothetical protein
MIETIEWGVLVLSATGLLVSSNTVSYIAGFKRAMGQFRLTNPFGPAPIQPRPDQQYITDYETMKGANGILNREITNLREQNRDLEKAVKILEGKIRASDRRRAKQTPIAEPVTVEVEKPAEEVQPTVKKYVRRKATASHAE